MKTYNDPKSEVCSVLSQANDLLHNVWQRPEVDGKETGWSVLDKDVEDDPMALGAVIIGMVVKGNRINIRRILLKNEDPSEVAIEIAEEIETKVLQIINEAKS